ncbi:hypothetical protein [Nitrosospira sp. NpAV]|nr:hypothetical protein [Nitrosospira sp. NpAV]
MVGTGILGALRDDGTLIEAWTSVRRLKTKDGSNMPPQDGGATGR